MKDIHPDYELLDTLPADSARVRFAGRFQQREVMWSAEIMTLRAYARECSTESGNACPARLRAFIDVGPEVEGQRTVLVGLPVGTIDEPVLKKCLVMLRNYKRLRHGRHEYGDEHEVNDA